MTIYSCSVVSLILVSQLFTVLSLSSISSSATIVRSRVQRLTSYGQQKRPNQNLSLNRINRSMCITMTQDCVEGDDGKTDKNSTIYRKKDVMLNVAKQTVSEAYSVKLPKGMENPVLTVKEQVISDRIKQSLEEDPTKTDLDLLKEELRKIIEKLG
jgi:hypothetical protein